MTVELVQAIGTHIVSPIAAAVMTVGVLWTIFKFTKDDK